MVEHLHTNKQRAIIQVTEGKYSGMIIELKDNALQIRNIPGRKNSSKKLLEYDDYFEANDLITEVKSIETPSDLIKVNEFIEKMNKPKEYPF